MDRLAILTTEIRKNFNYKLSWENYAISAKQKCSILNSDQICMYVAWAKMG